MNIIHSVKIELIPVLTTILETLSLTESAKRLGVTQSAISHSLRKLRNQLGDELVIRDGNKLSPTAKAEQMYPALKRWLGELESIVEAVDFEPKTSKKIFYIAATDIVEQMFMPQIVSCLKEKAPHVGIRLVRWNGELVYSQLMNSEINLAIGVRNFDYPNLMQKVLYKDTFASAARKSHPYFRSQMDLEDFLSFPHTMTSSGDRAKGVVDTALENISRSRILTHTVSNFSSAPFIVEYSDCILTAPKLFLETCSMRHEIQTFKPPLDLPSFDIKLFWSKKTQKDVANLWLRDILYSIFNDPAKSHHRQR